MNPLDAGFIKRTRQHHAIEHATVTILMRGVPSLNLLGGRSNHRGFYIYGDVETSLLETAVHEALDRLQGGESHLAIHPNCGTNLVTAGAMAGLAVLTTSTVGRRMRAGPLDQIPMAVLAATLAVVAGRPVGMALQARYTTLADVQGLTVGAISRRQLGSLIQHFVAIQPDPGA